MNLSKLWDPSFEDQVLDVLASLTDSQSPQLDVLFQALRDGPPVDPTSRDSLKVIEIAVLRRLIALDRAGITLPDDLRSQLAETEARYPGCREWTSPRRTPTAYWAAMPKPASIDFDAESLESVAQMVAHHPGWDSPEGAALDEHLEGLASANDPSLLQILRVACQVWTKELKEAVESPKPIYTRLPNYTAQLFEKWVSDNDARANQEALDIWDLLLPLGLAAERGGVEDTIDDRVTYAINHPVGDLVQALFAMLLPPTIKGGSGLPVDLCTRLEIVMHLDSSVSDAGKVIVSSRLFPLHFADNSWTAEKVVPFFDWTKPSAVGCWQGYLVSPRMSGALYGDIRQSFIEAYDHWPELDRYADSLSDLLVVLALEADGLMSVDDTRQCLVSMPPEGRQRVAWVLSKRLQEVGNKSSDLWSGKVSPWLDSCWPRDRKARDASTSDRLAWMATNTGAAFEEAVAFLLDRHLLAPVNERSMVVGHVLKADLARRYPKASLRLLDAILPEVAESSGTRWAVHGLDEVLQSALSADPTLADTDLFVGLRDRRSQ